MAVSRRGFSLVELIVVLGILILLAAIGAGAFVSSGRGNRLSGTEQLVTAALRQARYTARATGQAVLIYVDKDKATIGGVSRFPIWQTPCEPSLPPFRTGDALESYLVPYGRSGRGLGRTLTAAATAAAAYTFFDPAGTGDLRNRSLQITPNKTGATTGFQLTCAVRAPELTTTPQTLVPIVCVDGETGDVIPTSDGTPTSAYAGLLLYRRDMPMFGHGETPPSPALNVAFTPPKRACWDLVGWIRTESGIEIITNVTDAIDPSTLLPLDDVDKAARRIGYAGGVWEEVSLMQSDTWLELYRAGILVARRELAAAPRIAGSGQPHRLVMGSLSLAAGVAGALDLPPAPQLHIPVDAAAIDDVSLVRLGTDQAQQLPNGVVPYRAYAMIVRPDGRMSSIAMGGPSDPPGLPDITPGSIRWLFSGTQNERDDVAVIDLSPSTGAVVASTLSLQRMAK